MLSFFLHGWRSWKHARSVALLAIAALAVGIGSTTAIYSVVQAVLLNPLPYPNPNRFYMAFGAWRPHPDWWTTFSPLDAVDYSKDNTTLETFGCGTTGGFDVSLHGHPVHVTGTQMSPALGRALGVEPKIGHWFTSSGAQAASAYQAVISNSLWKRLGSDPNIVGKQLTMSGATYTITGVMPGWFRYPIEEPSNDVWIPLNPDKNQSKYRGYHYLRCIAKLKPGVTQAQAGQDLSRIVSRLQKQYPDQAEPDFIFLRSVIDVVADDIRPSLLLLLGAALALLLITCANVASVLLARSVARARETAIRVALGATTFQLGVQYFSEGLLVSVAGAVAGSFLAFALVRAVLAIAADEIPRAEQIAFNWSVLGFALAVAILCGVFFSLAPLWQARRTAPNEVLTEGTRSSASARSRKLLRIFVVAQVALAFGLLAIGGLLYAYLTGLYHVNPGFDPAKLLIFQMVTPNTRYPAEEAMRNYETKLIVALQQIPGVESAGFTSAMPLIEFGNNTWMQVEGRPQHEWSQGASIELRFVSPSYFQALKIPLIEGRFFNDNDKEGKVNPMLINQALAKLYWPHSNPVGSYVRIFAWKDARFQVVGVVGDVRSYTLANRPAPEFYLPYRTAALHHLMWAVRSALPPATLTTQIRKAVQSVDQQQAIFDIRMMQEVMQGSLSRQRLQSMMVTFFAGAALLLTILGIYGVVAYSVRQRLTDLGTRMAVGAAPRDVLRLVLGDGLRMGAIGIAIGLALVFAFARVLATSDLHVEISGPWPFIVATLVTVACTLLACWFPAWRATTLPPMIAIRSDVQSDWTKLRINYRILTERVAHIHNVEQDLPGTGADLLASLAEASRGAESFSEAVQIALTRVRDEIGGTSAFLFTRRDPGRDYRITAIIGTEDSRDLVLPGNALLVNRLRNYSSALPILPDDLAVLRRWAEEHANHRLPEIATLEHLHAALAVPLLSKSDIPAILLMGPRADGRPYSSMELKVVRSAAAQLALLLENGWLMERIVEQERLRRDMLLAAEVQKRLFPEGSLNTTNIQLAGICMPARGIGGDYYDFLDLDNGQIGIALADVAGKGVAAALIMSVVQASLRSLASSNGSSLSDLAGRMNRLLHRATAANSYATFFYAQFDEQRRRLRYVNAGHNPPFLLRYGNGAHIEELATGGMIIGMFAQSSYEEAALDVRAGDVLMLFSDGVTEAHNPSEDEFGEERVKDVLRRSAHLPINDMAAQILAELKTWMRDAPQHDDLTFVLMKVV
jgi:putative ABC transport system permease protein